MAWCPHHMVQHGIEVHGGTRPDYLSLIYSIEPKPLYRAAREAVLIGMQPAGPSNINRCQEWGTPQVPVLTAQGGDRDLSDGTVANPRPEWSRDQLNRIKQGTLKRIKYWNNDDSDETGSNVEAGGSEGPELEDPENHRKPAKRPRRDPEPVQAMTPEAPAGETVRQGGERVDLPARDGPSAPVLSQDHVQGGTPDSQPRTPQDTQDSQSPPLATLDPAQATESPGETVGGDGGGRGPSDKKEEMITDLLGPRKDPSRAATERPQDPGSVTSTPAAHKTTTPSVAMGPGALPKEEQGNGPESADPETTVPGPRSKARRSTMSYGSTDARERGMDPRTGAWGPAATVDQLNVGGRLPGTRRLTADSVMTQRLGLAAWIARGKAGCKVRRGSETSGQRIRRFGPGGVEGGHNKTKEQATESESGDPSGAQSRKTHKGAKQAQDSQGSTVDASI